jgi:hypothetical protein
MGLQFVTPFILTRIISMNIFELQTETVLNNHGNVQLIYIGESVVATKILKESTNKNKLFKNACSPYLTPTGRQKKTEFVYHSPSNNIDIRIECKSRKTLGLIGEITDELNFITNIPEKQYCLVLSEILLSNYILDRINTIVVEKELQDKIWVGSLEQFKSFLKEHIKL